MKTRTSDSISEASEFMKAFAHDGRLRILYLLADGEKSVGELIDALSKSQASVSQDIARLRLEGMIVGRREGHYMLYKICDGRVHQVLKLLHELFLKQTS